MRQRLLLLALPLALVLPACTEDDSPTIDDGGGEATTTSTTTDDDVTTSTSPGGSTPTSGGTAAPGIALSGPEGATGSLRFRLETARSEVCYRLTIAGAGPASASHVHRSTGEEVLALTPPGADGKVETCVASDQLLMEELDATPDRFYVDVHAERGVLRGNLG